MGSQYQTSLSEAMQDKYLYCLQRQSNGLDGGNKMIWRESERWKVQFGKRYFKVIIMFKLCSLIIFAI